MEASTDLREKSSVNLSVAENIRQENELEPDKEDYADKVLRTAEAHKRRRISASKYRSTKHVSPTTNVLSERTARPNLL